MHPILAQRGGLWLYLGAWVPSGGLLATMLALADDISWIESVALALPLALVYAFICLAAWYPAQGASPATGVYRLVTTQLVAGLFSSGLWIFLGAVWSHTLDRVPSLVGIHSHFRAQAPLLFVVGLLLYALATAGHYLLLAFEASRAAQSRNLELQVEAQEAQLQALQARRDHELAEKELELARTIQRRLLPPPEMEGAGYRLAARNLPAQVVAGDFYDVFGLADGTLGIVVADVAGKGLGASLIMASVKSVLPFIAASHSVVETLAELNRKLVGELGPREFVALAFARFDPTSGRLELANSGLPDPYLLRPRHGPQTIEVPGPRLPLGVRGSVEYESALVKLHPCDRVLLLTDGIPEASTRAGEPLGYEELNHLMALVTPAPGSPARWLDAFLRRIDKATADPHEDDLTALLLEHHNPSFEGSPEVR